jgi:hypothetical protein
LHKPPRLADAAKKFSYTFRAPTLSEKFFERTLRKFFGDERTHTHSSLSLTTDVSPQNVEGEARTRDDDQFLGEIRHTQFLACGIGIRVVVIVVVVVIAPVVYLQQSTERHWCQ